MQFVAQAEFDELVLDPEKWFVSQREGVDSVFVCIEGEAELSMGTTAGIIKRGDAAYARFVNGQGLQIRATRAGFRCARITVPDKVDDTFYPSA